MAFEYQVLASQWEKYENYETSGSSDFKWFNQIVASKIFYSIFNIINKHEMKILTTFMAINDKENSEKFQN